MLRLPRMLGFAWFCSLSSIGRVSTNAVVPTASVAVPLFRRNQTPLNVALHTQMSQHRRAVDILQDYLTRNGSEAFKPMVLCGPSGVGKSYLIRQLTKLNPTRVMTTTSHTTRAPRGTEQNGTEYHFVSRDQFQNMIRNGQLVEYDEIHGNFYGTSFEAIKTVHAQNKTCVMDLTIAGASQFMEACSTWQTGLGIPAPWIFYIRPESLESLEKWLRSRQTESDESLHQRLAQAATELDEIAKIDLFDAIITKTWDD
eukprot:m.22130 g.22130  ORF g.22130 m.22130 type:complete len:256 (+) comp13699_c0_seq1:77-844(+)